MEYGQILKDEEFLPVAQALIENAHKSILITTFKAEITHKPRGRRLKKFFDTLIKKADNGLDVRVILNKNFNRHTIPHTNYFAIRELDKSRIKVRTPRNDRICHAKLLLVDGLAAIIGSHNYSVKSCHNNFEVSYLINNAYIATQLVTIYNHIWEKSIKA